MQFTLWPHKINDGHVGEVGRGHAGATRRVMCKCGVVGERAMSGGWCCGR